MYSLRRIVFHVAQRSINIVQITILLGPVGRIAGSSVSSGAFAVDNRVVHIPKNLWNGRRDLFR